MTPPSKSSSPLAALAEFGAMGTGTLTRWMFFSRFFQDELRELVSTEPPGQHQLIGLQIPVLGDTAHRDRARRK